MTLHMRFEYPISVPSFVPVHWLVFFCTCVDAEEQEDDDETTRASYTKHYRAYVISTTLLSDMNSYCVSRCV